MTEYRVTMKSEYAYIEQSYRDLDRANKQAKTWRLTFPTAVIKIDRVLAT